MLSIIALLPCRSNFQFAYLQSCPVSASQLPGFSIQPGIYCNDKGIHYIAHIWSKYNQTLHIFLAGTFTLSNKLSGSLDAVGRVSDLVAFNIFGVIRPYVDHFSRECQSQVHNTVLFSSHANSLA